MIECVDGDGGLAEDFLNDADLAVVPRLVPVREARAWLCDWHGERGVLRGRPVPPDAVVRSRLQDDVAWLHAFLARLAGQGFPAPRPLPAFHGESWTAAGGQLWELVSFIPGREVGWDSRPPLDQIGALLARYHATARRITMDGQRPGVIPLAEVPAILLSDKLAGGGLSPQQAAVIRRLAERLAADLEDIAGSSAAPIVIHGDFTAHNVIACGIPPRLAGVIDFQRPRRGAGRRYRLRAVAQRPPPPERGQPGPGTPLAVHPRLRVRGQPPTSGCPRTAGLPVRPRPADDRQAGPGGPCRDLAAGSGAVDSRARHGHRRHRGSCTSVAGSRKAEPTGWPDRRRWLTGGSPVTSTLACMRLRRDLAPLKS
jgi:Phosphotransferase enzyme family